MLLFIDDEPEYIENYELALNDMGFEVNIISDIDEALNFIKSPPDDLEAIILDIMMSFGNSFDEKETEQGTRTGIYFYKKIRENLPQIQIFPLTNVTDETVKNHFEGDENCHFTFKKKPFEFAKLVKKTLRK